MIFLWRRLLQWVTSVFRFSYCTEQLTPGTHGGGAGVSFNAAVANPELAITINENSKTNFASGLRIFIVVSFPNGSGEYIPILYL